MNRVVMCTVLNTVPSLVKLDTRKHVTTTEAYHFYD